MNVALAQHKKNIAGACAAGLFGNAFMQHRLGHRVDQNLGRRRVLFSEDTQEANKAVIHLEHGKATKP